MTLLADFFAEVGDGKIECQRLDVLKPSTAPAWFGGGAFEAAALTTVTLTQHKQRPSGRSKAAQ